MQQTLSNNPIQSLVSIVQSLPALAWQFVMDRLSKIDFFDETKTADQQDSPWYQLGGMYYFAWVIVMITGVALIAFYLPTTTQAFNSVDALSEHILGSLLRGMHKYGGDAMIIAGTLRVYRMWFNAEYKNKGEFTFILAIILLLMAMYSGLSGYLLIWNQRAFWATKVFATFPTYLDITPKNWYWPWEGSVLVNGNTWLIPNMIGAVTKVIGDWTHQGMSTSQILMGGSSIGQATMTRFFSLHFAISVFLLIGTELYFYKNRLKRINLSRGAILTVLAMIIVVALIFPAESGSRANPEVTPLPILSDWYFLALYQMLKYMDPYWATIWTVGIPAITIKLMFLDLGPEKNPWKRPLFTTIAIMAFIQFLIFSLLIIANVANLDKDPPYWFASTIFFITIGQFWHWSLYRQPLPMILWVGFNVASALFYLWFWHVQAGPWLSILAGLTFDPTHFVIPAAQKALMTDAGFDFTNLYWNFLWTGYALIQGAVAMPLIAGQLLSRKGGVPMGGVLPDAPAHA